jgi:drug/metabolite transporter (DMT)-like permease
MNHERLLMLPVLTHTSRLPTTNGVVRHTSRMIAILSGLTAASLWAATTLTSSRAGRLIGSTSTCAWMMLVGVAVAVPMAVVTGPLPEITPALVPWLAGSSIGGVAGLLLTYRGLRLGKVGVVAALASTEGAIAAVLAVVAGERLTLPVAAVLVLLAVGVAVVAFAEGDAEMSDHGANARRLERRAAMYGGLAALLFGISIFSTAQLGKSLSPFAAVLPVRVGGVIGVFIPMVLSGKLRLTRPAVPMVLLIGAGEVFGNAAYVVGTGESIAVTAVLASQFAGIAAIAAWVLFHERLTIQQRSGVVAIAAGVAALTLVR